jgi:hypothetical protein
MTYNGIAKVQHYVPQFLLKNFGNGKKNQLHVFDKSSGRSFPTNAKNIACESRFYDFRIEDVEATLEPKLSELESLAKPLFDRILDQDSVEVFDVNERALMCSFLAVQFTRTKSFREQWLSLPEMLGERLKQMVKSPEELKHIANYITAPTENEAKRQTAQFIINAPSDFGPHFANKTWHLLSTTKKNPFYISDNPLTLQNMKDLKQFGNLGLAVQGIEIYFPISPTRALALWCPTLKQAILAKAHSFKSKRNFFSGPYEISDQLKKLISALESGKPIEYASENVINFNALQISHAERYIFSNAADFTLPQKMISAHPSLQKGKRMKIA